MVWYGLVLFQSDRSASMIVMCQVIISSYLDLYLSVLLASLMFTY